MSKEREWRAPKPDCGRCHGEGIYQVAHDEPPRPCPCGLVIGDEDTTPARSRAMSEERFQKVIAPQPGDWIASRGREKIEMVVAYWPDFRAWEVRVVDDHGRRADTRGNPITRMVRNASFGKWAIMPER